MIEALSLLLISAVTLLPIIGIFAVGLILFLYFKKEEDQIDNQWRREAQTSGATFWKGHSDKGDLNSILFKGGRFSKIERLLRYPNGTEVGEASFRYNNDFLISFDFATVPLTKYDQLWLVVDSRINNMSGRSLIDMAMARVSGKLSPLALEGNFRDTYKVYANPGQQIAALTALNPASMEKLLFLFDKYDTEIADNRLYIFARAAGVNTQEFRNNMITDVKALAAILQ